MYTDYFYGKTKNGYNAVCFKLKSGIYYTVVQKEGKLKVYDDYTRLERTEEVPNIADFQKKLSDYFAEIEAKMQAARQERERIETFHRKNIASFGDNAHNIAGYCYANKLEPTRQRILSKNVSIRDVKNHIKSMSSKSADRLLAKPFPCKKMTKKEKILHLFKHLLNAAAALPDSGYSMGEVKKINISGVTVSVKNNCEDYAKSCKWRARHGSISINLTIKEGKNAKIVGGMLTIAGDLVGNGVRTADWFMKGKGYSEIERISGYLAGDYHFTAKSLKDAKDIAKKHYKEVREQKARERKYSVALKRKDARTWVTYQDSINGGNCETGTKNFAGAIRFALENMGAIRADYLLKKAEEKKVLNFANRAVNAAKLRHAGITA